MELFENERNVHMKNARWIAIFGMVLSLAIFARFNPALSEEVGKQTAAVFEKENKFRMKYLIYLPKDYDQKESWPLLLFLHGGGERGDNLDLVKLHGPPMLIEKGKEYPFIVVSPQCTQIGAWDPKRLAVLLDEIVEKCKVDRDRISVTGLCMGGTGTWDLAAEQPNRFAALVPICSGGDSEKTKLYADVAVWVFHGKKDNVVPISESERMVEALRKNGGNVKFTVYPEAGHNSWAETYDNPKLYEWLLEQKRPNHESEKP
jgi:predicted peptidase